jgi:hypothetical protein
MESYRTPQDPTQIILLDLGKLELAETQLKLLADRVEQIVKGQEMWSIGAEYTGLSMFKRLKSGRFYMGNELSEKQIELLRIDPTEEKR